MAWTEHLHRDRDTLVHACTQHLQEAVNAALTTQGYAHLALAGGQTPLPIYRELATAPLDWPSVSIMATDERWVPHSAATCNLSQLRACFALPAAPTWHSLTPVDAQGQPHLMAAHAALADVDAPFDATLLGMGADGHFASLFPGANNLEAALALDAHDDVWVIQPNPLPPEAPHARISLGLARLLRSRTLLLVVTGNEKLALIRAAQANPAAQQWPITALLHAPGARVDIHWSP